MVRSESQAVRTLVICHTRELANPAMKSIVLDAAGSSSAHLEEVAGWAQVPDQARVRALCQVLPSSLEETSDKLSRVLALTRTNGVESS